MDCNRSTSLRSPRTGNLSIQRSAEPLLFTPTGSVNDSSKCALDGMVQYRFGDNAELMGAWRSARNVLGPFKN